MWQKIKQRLRHHWMIASLPLFAKMVLLYSSVVFCILLTVSIITLTSVHYIINDSIKDDLTASAESTIAYLDSYGKIDASVFIRSNLPTVINLQIYNSAGKLILDNGPTHSIKRLSDRYIDDTIANTERSPLPQHIQGDETSEFSYYKKWRSPDGTDYYLRFSRQPDRENGFVSLLSKQLLASVFISLILTIFVGLYVMKKSLAPLQTMNDTIKKIEVNQLGKRITLSNNRNELHDLAVTINEALDRIEYGYKQQQQFINDASHELRTPITSISGYVNLLDRWGKDDPETLQEGLTAIKTETEYMCKLIERLLFFARTTDDTFSMQFKDVDTADMMLNLYDELLTMDRDHEIILEQNDRAIIRAEPGSVKQMLRIFADNAKKYTPAGGKIILSCRQVEKKIHFSIADTGIGIPEKEQQRVFERFYRVDRSRAKSTGGSGLGLAIATYIAKGNQAELHLESKVNVGTKITVSFAVKEEEPPAGEDTSAIHEA